MSVRVFPPRFALWNAGSPIGDLYQGTLQYPARSCSRWGARARRRGHPQLAFLKAARATTNATSYMARFLPDLQERKADWDIVLKAMDDGQQLVDLNPAHALRRAARGDPCRTGGAPSSVRTRLRTLQRHDDDDPGPHRLAADDARHRSTPICSA